MQSPGFQPGEQAVGGSPANRSDFAEAGNPDDYQEPPPELPMESPPDSPGVDWYNHGRTPRINMPPLNDDDRARIVFLPLRRTLGFADNVTSVTQEELPTL
jgi:hypothetical protein